MAMMVDLVIGAIETVATIGVTKDDGTSNSNRWPRGSYARAASCRAKSRWTDLVRNSVTAGSDLANLHTSRG